jgi:ABC-type branched-subunit amino acid transport system ATPase component
MTPLLSVDGVSKAFGGLQALVNCSLNVEQGSINGLIGPNGSGKTTLFNVITGFLRCDQGTIRLGDQVITRAGPDRVFALGVGRTFQITRVFARLTVLENMLVATQRHESWLRSLVRSAGSPAERDRAMGMLSFVGLSRLASSPAGNLSYGQRKLLELAYVLVADPSVILLDEPAAGVNPSLLNEIRDRIVELNSQGKTFLIVEHNMEFVMNLCHRVTVMHQGRPLISGPPVEVRQDPRVLDAYLGGAEQDDEASD